MFSSRPCVITWATPHFCTHVKDDNDVYGAAEYLSISVRDGMRRLSAHLSAVGCWAYRDWGLRPRRKIAQLIRSPKLKYTPLGVWNPGLVLDLFILGGPYESFDVREMGKTWIIFNNSQSVSPKSWIKLMGRHAQEWDTNMMYRWECLRVGSPIF